MCSPGMNALDPAPASKGTRMVFTRDRSRGPGESATAELPVSRSQHSTKGMVKMPARLVPTVRSSANAVLPPTACASVGYHPDGVSRCRLAPSSIHYHQQTVRGSMLQDTTIAVPWQESLATNSRPHSPGGLRESACVNSPAHV